ncbi:MAG: O-antigen ligase family protein [Burkholderiaceae bacterium]|nr:O-antigen ligase family protein [Burkholderiaceae bacterium]
MDSSVLITSGLLAVGAVVTFVVIALGLWLYIRSTTYKTVPIALLLIGFCLESAFGTKQPYVQLGLQIYPNDVISLFVLMSTFAGLFYRPLPVHRSPFLLWLAFGVTIILSFLVGLGEYGRYAGTEVRPFFYLWVAGLYACTADFDDDELRRIGRWCVWAAYAFIGISIILFGGVEAGLIDRKEYFGDAEGTVFRPIGSHAVFFVAAVALVQAMAWLRGSGTRHSGLHAALLLIFVTVLQHRSVWIAAIFGLLCVMLLERRHLPRRFPLLLGFVLVVTLSTAVAAWLGALDDLGRRLVQSTVSMGDSQGTFAARVDGWERLVEQWVDASAWVAAFGFPFGRGYTRMYNGQLIEFAPHNFYLDLVLRVGVVGAIFFILATLMAIVGTLRAKCESEFEYLLTRGLSVGLMASLVYNIAYPSYYIVGGATGVALAYIMRQRKRPVVVPQAMPLPPRAHATPMRHTGVPVIRARGPARRGGWTDA